MFSVASLIHFTPNRANPHVVAFFSQETGWRVEGVMVINGSESLWAQYQRMDSTIQPCSSIHQKEYVIYKGTKIFRNFRILCYRDF